MKKSNPITFFGSDHFSARILKGLIDAGWPIPLVVTRPRQAKGQSRFEQSQPVLDICESRQLEVMTPDKWNESAVSELSDASGDVGVLASFGMLLPHPVLDRFTLGIVNVHPSLLPRWRGASPIESALLHGDAKTGVSLMRLVAKLDAGPLYAQREVALKGDETQASLYESLAEVGSDLLLEELPKIVSNTTEPTPQPESGVTFAPHIEKSDGQIDWSLPAINIERQIRAFQTWPRSRTQLYGRDVIIVSAALNQEQLPADRPEEHGRPFLQNKRLYVTTGDGVLEIKEIKPAGKPTMSGQAFFNGYSAA